MPGTYTRHEAVRFLMEQTVDRAVAHATVAELSMRELARQRTPDCAPRGGRFDDGAYVGAFRAGVSRVGIDPL